MRATTPESLAITVRDIHFESAAPRWWHGGDPVATAFFNALSASFPLGERYFIDSVKRFRDVADAPLKAQIDGFVMQESIHTREHLAFNGLAEDCGYDLRRIDAFLKRRLGWARSRGPREQLASTVALEHFTAILAHALLSNPSDLEGAPEAVQRLWRWHAMEELEHKAVAFDTFFVATRSYTGFGRWLLRSYVMFVTTILFLHEVVFGVGEFLRQDGKADAATWLKFLRYVLVRPGILRRVFGRYLAFYRPGFHPWRVDDRALIREFELSLTR
ncbi:MAG TPA: metal-dependent hydrolase [Rhizomicrobium sp.]|nr:metal-dependent hydrolase [Rhizomicrobium sp.]